uniref:Uncharacterized protein n=1 Tax=Octopus bimaculoides TaxID=37653 RepID=A0A0L8HMF4_OCTBM
MCFSKMMISDQSDEYILNNHSNYNSTENLWLDRHSTWVHSNWKHSTRIHSTGIHSTGIHSTGIYTRFSGLVSNNYFKKIRSKLMDLSSSVSNTYLG